MIELSEGNVAEYLRGQGRVSAAGDVLVKSLSGGIANVVLKVFDTGAGQRAGADLRSREQMEQQAADLRPFEGACFVLKQPLPKFRTEAEWLVDIDRVVVERDCMELLGTLLPAGSVPRVLWYDEASHVLAISCAPADAVIWKKVLLAGEALVDASTHAGMLLAMMHSSTQDEAEIKARYGDPLFFTQQRVDPYLRTAAAKHPEVATILEGLCGKLLGSRLCLIHGDYSPKNIFLVPDTGVTMAGNGGAFPLGHLMLLDFEVAFYGHPAFDVATLINHFLLKGFYHGRRWRRFMVLADNFWQTYRNTSELDLVKAAGRIGGHLLGALMLARVDGKSPVEYLNAAVQAQVRTAALALLAERESSLENALDVVSQYFDEAE